MKRMEEAKQKYDSIQIPDELSGRVMMAVKEAENINRKKIVKMRRNLFMKRTAAAAAAAAVLFTAGVNTSQTFAQSVSNIPLIGSISSVITFRSYEAQTETAEISVDIPSIQMISEEFSELEKQANEEIHAFCTQYADQAAADAEEYKKAFLETGGTEKEWAEHDIKIKVWYEVKSQTDDYLSLAVMGNNNWNNAGYEAKYYNLDIKSGKWITAEEFLGDEGKKSAEKSIRSQINQREKETGMEFWGDEWKGIDENTKSYINSSGNLVIVFGQYEIAPGAAGQQEFEITK